MITKVKLRTALCRALMLCMSEMTNEQCEYWLKNKDDQGNMLLDVQFSINGVEADFSKLLDMLYDRYDEMVLSSARNLLQEKISGIISQLSDIEQSVGNLYIDVDGNMKV